MADSGLFYWDFTVKLSVILDNMYHAYIIRLPLDNFTLSVENLMENISIATYLLNLQVIL